jgi:HPt (histidine-containing phosphotransfer) domain-containing protein
LINNLLDENVVAQFSSLQIKTYFSLYLKNANAIIENILVDFGNSNWDSLRQRAHKLKGSSMVVGAIAMKKISNEIEDAVRNNIAVEPEKIEELKEQYKQLADLLQNRFNVSFERG